MTFTISRPDMLVYVDRFLTENQYHLCSDDTEDGKKYH